MIGLRLRYLRWAFLIKIVRKSIPLSPINHTIRVLRLGWKGEVRVEVDHSFEVALGVY